MSLIKANAVQVGQSPTATQNFTLAVPSSPDGTIKLARGNAGATTQDVLNVSNTGVVSFPQGFATSSITANVTGNVTGDVFASNGTSKVLENGTNGTDATFTGSVSGGTLSGNASSATALATESTASRSLANRFGDVANVLDFGADPTGVVDSTDEIQNAINSPKQYIYIPQGNYKISATLNLSSVGKYIFGAGNQTTTISAEHTNGPVFQIKQRACRIENLFITAIGARLALATTNSNNHGIQIAGTNDSGTTTLTYIKSVLIDNQPDCGVYIAKSALNSIVEQCSFQNNRSHGILLDDGTYAGVTTDRLGMVNFNSCRSTSNGGFGVCISPSGGSCYRIVFDNLESYSNCSNPLVSGLTQSNAYIRCQNIAFKNCAFGGDGTKKGFELINGTTNFECTNFRAINLTQIVDCVSPNLTGIYFDNFYVEPALTLPAFDISAGTTGVFIRAANSNNITTMVTSASRGGTYWIGQNEYVIMDSFSFSNTHFHVNGVANFTVVSGSVRIAAGTVIITGEGNVADSISGFFPTAPGELPNGTKFTIVNPNAYNITINNGSGNIRTKTAANIVLGQYEAASFTTNKIGPTEIYFES